MKLEKFLLTAIVILALVLRFYRLGEIPAGIHQDEESHGYNAFSLLKTGKDRYGEAFPILFRSFGSYQPPIYTYLAIIPVGIFGNSIAAARSVSAVAGVVLVLITYFFSLEFFRHKAKKWLALTCALVVAISPWSIYFSRLVAEGNLGVMFFVLSLLIFLISLKKASFFPLATAILAFSTHAYYSERVIAVLFLPAFVFLYRKYFWQQNRRWFIFGLGVFVLAMLPHAFILSSGALTRRLTEVGYLGQRPFIFEFVRRYLIYLSPRNLFFDLGAGLGRMPPELGVFYTIFLIPFFVGIKNLRKYLTPKFLKVFVLLIAVTPLAAALTGDSYYPLRSLDLIWLVGLVVSVGIFVLWQSLPKKLAIVIFAGILLQSVIAFYISYFIFFKYERAKDYGNAYISLIPLLEKYKNHKVIIDSARNPGAGLRIAYLTAFDPISLQTQLRSQLKTPYYSKEVALYEDYIMGNIEFHKIDWGEISCTRNLLIIGDILSISEAQAEEHNLKFEFEVKDISGDNGLIGYTTQPISQKCAGKIN